MKKILLIALLTMVGGATLYYFILLGSKRVEQSSLEVRDVRSIISRYDIKQEDERDKMIIALEEYAGEIQDEVRRREVWFKAAEVLGISVNEMSRLREEVNRRLEDEKPQVGEPTRALKEYTQEGINVLREALGERVLYKDSGVIEGVKTIATPEGIGFLKEVLQNGNLTLRIYAAGALLRLGDTSGIEILKYAISDRVQNWQIKLYGGEVLAEKGYSEGMSVIERYLDDDQPWYIRADAGRSAGVVNTERMKERLTEMLSDTNLYVRLGAAEGLARMGNADGLNYLRDALGSDSTTIQHTAAEALARLGDASVRAYFRKEMASDDKFVKLKAAKNLALTGDYAGIDFIEALLKDDEELRFYAAQALIEIGARKGHN